MFDFTIPTLKNFYQMFFFCPHGGTGDKAIDVTLALSNQVTHDNSSILHETKTGTEPALRNSESESFRQDGRSFKFKKNK